MRWSIDEAWLCVNLGRNVGEPILLQTTPLCSGGKRWWFTCPLAGDGGGCLRRVGRLYLPTGAVYFGCRQCYALTYESCRMAHRWGRIARLMAEVATHADPKRLRRILAGLME
ncbi:MAG: hypothetical protein JRK53_12855 [Deltaproteobacteria bacterium]|nr:hypothetical protein [Deltaproteobacteria bacterium]